MENTLNNVMKKLDNDTHRQEDDNSNGPTDNSESEYVVYLQIRARIPLHFNLVIYNTYIIIYFLI